VKQLELHDQPIRRLRKHCISVVSVEPVGPNFLTSVIERRVDCRLRKVHVGGDVLRWRQLRVCFWIDLCSLMGEKRLSMLLIMA